MPFAQQPLLARLIHEAWRLGVAGREAWRLAAGFSPQPRPDLRNALGVEGTGSAGRLGPVGYGPAGRRAMAMERRRAVWISELYCRTPQQRSGKHADRLTIHATGPQPISNPAMYAKIETKATAEGAPRAQRGLSGPKPATYSIQPLIPTSVRQGSLASQKPQRRISRTPGGIRTR